MPSSARAGTPPAADRRPDGDDLDAPRPAPPEAALGRLGNAGAQRAAHDGTLAGALVRQGAGPLGNQAVMRMLAVMRHAGTEGWGENRPHKAGDHAAVEDQREHDRQVQRDFDKLTSKETLERLTGLAKTESPTIKTIALEDLPPALQALVRSVQAPITELEIALAAGPLEDEEAQNEAEDRLRDHIRAGARSWHDNTPGLLPPVDPKKTRSPRGDFFVRWRAEDAAGGRTTTNKQEKNLAKIGGQSSLLPHREYTAVGWKEAEQSGRLLYDPIEDQLYLSVIHYQDKFYFRILAPRPKVAAAAAPIATRATRWDIEFLIFRAWERLAEELTDLDLDEDEEGQEAQAEGAAPRLTERNAPEAVTCVRALMAVRKLHADAYREARDTFRRMLAAWEQLSVNAAKIRATGKTPKTEPGEKPKPLQVNAAFEWCGQTFCVNADNGYIGYLKAKPKSQRGRGEDTTVELPSYSQTATMRVVATAFRDCVIENALVHPIDDVAQALAAMVAEPSRHPPALMEAVFSLLVVSPLEERKAFGKGNTAFPMAAGGTDATGGVPVRVVRQEAALGLEVILNMLATHLKLEPKQVADLLTDVAETKGAADALAWVQGILRAALLADEPQHEEVGRLFASGRSALRADASVVSLLAQPLSPATAIALPDAGTQTATAVAEEAESEELESESEDGPLTPEALRAILGPGLRGTLWEAYRDYQSAHPSRDYVLTYWEVLAFAANRDPGVPPDREPTGAELRTIDEFIRRHPEFRYEKDF